MIRSMTALLIFCTLAIEEAGADCVWEWLCLDGANCVRLPVCDSVADPVLPALPAIPPFPPPHYLIPLPPVSPPPGNAVCMPISFCDDAGEGCWEEVVCI